MFACVYVKQLEGALGDGNIGRDVRGENGSENFLLVHFVIIFFFGTNVNM